MGFFSAKGLTLVTEQRAKAISVFLSDVGTLISRNHRVNSRKLEHGFRMIKAGIPFGVPVWAWG